MNEPIPPAKSSSLYDAIGEKRFSVARELTELGIGMQYSDRNGITALHRAALIAPPDGPELIRLLVIGGAKVDKMDDDWATPLQDAVQFNLPQNVEALLEDGADVNGMNKYGFTPLLFALSFFNADDRIEVIEVLLRYNADTYVVNKSHDRYNGGKDALQMANHRSEEVAAIIRRHREQEIKQ